MTFVLFCFQKIKKDLRKYYPRFQLEDKMRESKASKEQIEARRSMMEEYQKWREIVEEDYLAEKEARMALRDGEYNTVFHLLSRHNSVYFVF